MQISNVMKTHLSSSTLTNHRYDIYERLFPYFARPHKHYENIDYPRQHSLCTNNEAHNGRKVDREIMEYFAAHML